MANIRDKQLVEDEGQYPTLVVTGVWNHLSSYGCYTLYNGS